MKMDVRELNQLHHFLEMGDKAHKGEEVIIMRDGHPWLRLDPCPGYKSPPSKSREELRNEFWGKLSESERAGMRSLSLNLERDKPMAYLPERELCPACLAKYQDQTTHLQQDNP